MHLPNSISWPDQLNQLSWLYKIHLLFWYKHSNYSKIRPDTTE